MTMETLCTIGFTKKSLRSFVDLLKSANVTKVVDIRLRNTSQLAGFAKKDDLEFVLDLCGIAYEHVPELAPTDELLDEYHKTKDWEHYEKGYRALLQQRDPLPYLGHASGGHAKICLLCTEDKPDKCHRRLVAEYFKEHVRGVVVKHL